MKIHQTRHQKKWSKRGQMANRLVLTCGVTVVTGLPSMAAYAQDASAAPASAASQPAAVPANGSPAPGAAAPNSTAENIGQVVVTARRRNEALVDVPLAISVVTAAKIDQLGISTTTELANFVPGLEFNQFTPGNARNDAGPDRNIAIRGLLLSGGGAASMFLNGAAVIGNEVPVSLDIGQAEVLRGPQSVYFGRSTMTGAVSYRTKPIPDHLSGEVQVEAGQRDLKNIEASVAGPIIPGVLAARLTGVTDSSDGYVTNDYNNGASKLGATSRKSLSGTVEFTPIRDLSFKGYFNHFRDDDGPSATAFIPASLDNCQLPGATQMTFCGEIPDRSHSINYINTTIPTNMSNLIFSTPLISGADFKHKVGQQREASNSDVTSTWNINDYLTLESITGYHTNISMDVADGIGQPIQPTFPYSSYFYTFTQKFNDFSQELRLSSDPEERFSWTAGANYISAETYTDAIVGFVTQPAGTFLQYPQALGRQENTTLGLFAGGYYKVTPALTMSVEAREQSDRPHALSNDGTTGALLSDLSATFKSFNPRFAVDYDLGHREIVYASYATGTRPGGFNTGIAAQAGNPAALAQISQLLGGGGTDYKEEKLKMGELGFKGELADGKGFFDINAYAGTLLNQQITIGALIPVLGYSVTGTANAGESKVYGIEFQGDYNFTHGLSLNTTFAWNHTERTKYLNTAGLSEFGTTDFDGKAFAQVPEFSGSAVLAYTHDLSDGWSAYSNVAEVYRGKEYMDAFDASYIRARFQTDLRAGVSNKKYTFEAYVKNVFNDQHYTGGGVTPDYGTGSYNAFFGGWAPPRQFGGRFDVKF